MDAEKMLAKLEMTQKALEDLGDECGEGRNFGDPQDMANIAHSLLSISENAGYVALKLYSEIDRKCEYTPIKEEAEAEKATA